MIDRVTVTGADNSISPLNLVPLTQRYPFVEWGILLSLSQEGKRSRYPSKEWLEYLIANEPPGQFSGHLCGRWVRDLCAGESTFADERPELFEFFDRIQLNFHGIKHETVKEFVDEIKKYPKEYIFQFDGENESIFHLACSSGANVSALFDKSGGAGVLPDKWPNPIESIYCGYAGGLGPHNLKEQIEKILEVTKDHRIWIDCETWVRSPDDMKFDLEKVEQFLEIAKPFVG